LKQLRCTQLLESERAWCGLLLHAVALLCVARATAAALELASCCCCCAAGCCCCENGVATTRRNLRWTGLVPADPWQTDHKRFTCIVKAVAALWQVVCTSWASIRAELVAGRAVIGLSVQKPNRHL